MAVAALVLWVATAAAGLALLRAGGAARRASAESTHPAEVSVGALARIGAVPLTADGKPPPGPHVRVASQPGEHPLLEFGHPALAVTGVACWLMYTLVHYLPFAWISVAMLVVTMLAGSAWFLRNRRAAGRPEASGWTFPPRLIALHGAVAALSITLTVVTALVASHG